MTTKKTNFLWTVRHQGPVSREMEAFDNPAEFYAFIRENERYLLGIRKPSRAEIADYAAWIKRHPNHYTRRGIDVDALLNDLRTEWRKTEY